MKKKYKGRDPLRRTTPDTSTSEPTSIDLSIDLGFGVSTLYSIVLGQEIIFKNVNDYMHVNYLAIAHLLMKLYKAIYVPI